MNKVLAFLLAALACFAQAPTVKYTPLASSCDQVPMVLRGFVSCAVPRTQVVAHSANPKIAGFVFVVTYHEAGVEKTISVWTVPASQLPDGSFQVVFSVDAATIINVSALELLTGDVGYAP